MLEFNPDTKAKFVAALKATAIIAPKDDIRQFLNGIYLEVKDNHVRVTSSDGHRILTCLVNNCFTNNDKGKTFSIILQIDKVKYFVDSISDPRAMLDLIEMAESKESAIGVVINNDTVLRVYGVPGRFPAFRSVMQPVQENSGRMYGINPVYLADVKPIAKEFAKATKTRYPGTFLTQHGSEFFITFDCFDAIYEVLGMIGCRPYNDLDSLIGEFKTF